MKLLSLKNSSVFFSLVGVMLLTIGFNGFMAHTYSNSTVEIDGVRLVKPKDLGKSLENNEKVCIVSPIYSDDTFAMPDNGQKVVKGRLYMSAVWPDGSQTILINWSKQSNYIRLADSATATGEAISPKNIECASDTAMANAKLKITRTPNTASIDYYQYHFNLSGCFTKGQPEIVIQREYLLCGDNVAVTMQKSPSETKPEVLNVVPYNTALARERLMSKSKTIYIIIGIVGILMLFIPEEKAINTISNIKMIGSKILSKQQ